MPELEKALEKQTLGSEVVLDDLSNTDNSKKTKKTSNQKRFRGDTNKLSPMVADIISQIDDMVIGQNEAKKELGLVLTKSLAYDPSNRKPKGVLFFAGPTGVGKTEIVRSLFKIIYGDQYIDLDECKIDCNRFTLSHEVAQLKGSPAGYTGFGKKSLLHPEFIFKHTNNAITKNTLHPLFKKIMENDSENLPSIILLDEFEKAHPDFHNFFMGIFDEGTTTLSDGTLVNFRNTIFVMTSNLGATDIQKKLEGKGSMGFVQEDNSVSTLFTKEYYTKTVKESNLFKPEFVARIDVIPFLPLSLEDFYKRLDLSISSHNKNFSYTDKRLVLTKRAKSHLVNSSFKTNEGARSLTKMFEHDIYSRFTRLTFNREVERVEEESGFSVKYIQIDYVDNEFVEFLLIDEDKKALNKELKRRVELERRKKNLLHQALEDNSFLITLKEVLLPNLKYYKALIKQKDNLIEDYLEETKNCRNILLAFGLQETDFELLDQEMLENKYHEYDNVFNELNLLSSGVLLWDQDDNKNLFSGMLRIIEKYIRKYFDNNNDLKVLVSSGAGKLSEAMEPIFNFSRKVLDRELNFDEENILISIFYREYIKLNSSSSSVKLLENKSKPKKEEKQTKKEEKTDTKTNLSSRPITININFGKDGNETDFKQRLKNLFQEDYEYVILAIKQNVAEKKDVDDIIDIMNSIKISLSRGFDLSSEQISTITSIVQDLLKEEEIFKKK